VLLVYLFFYKHSEQTISCAK